MAYSRVLLGKLNAVQLVKKFPALSRCNVHYCVYKGLMLDLILSWMNNELLFKP